MKTINRLKNYIDYKRISLNQFNERIGAGTGYIGKQIKNNASIGTDIIEKIFFEFEEINPEWLLTGRGSMLRPVEGQGKKEISKNTPQALEETQAAYQQKSHISQRVTDLMHKKGFNYRSFGKFLGYADVSIAQIVKGKRKPNMAFLDVLIEKIPNLNPEWLLTGKGKMFRTADGEREDNSRAPQVLQESYTDQQLTEVEVQSQEAVDYSSDNKEKDLIIEKLKNDLTEQKQSHEQIMEEKEYIIHSLESRLAHKDKQIEEQKVNCEHVIKEQAVSFERVIEDQKSNFERIIVGRDKQIESLECQIEDLKINMERLISEKSEVVKMKDEMLAMKEEAIKGKNEIVRIQSKRIAELESHKELEEAKKIYLEQTMSENVMPSERGLVRIEEKKSPRADRPSL